MTGIWPDGLFGATSCPDTTLGGKAHDVIATYDKRADVENLVGEARREGLDAIPSGRFKNNHAFFQIAMPAYTLRRYFKMMAHPRDAQVSLFTGVKDNTICIARLKLPMIAAKVVRANNRDRVKYSIHDTRTPGLLICYELLDRLRLEKKQACNASLF
ncbi:MAG: hypothetical protein M0Q23_08685 [Syntrophales bacterium]|nr:hypothetical protein [Syntrophales bacterium]MCK9528695.1 hypothetical protein [Syntrophales bacterium]MDX9922648.1 hypothetical protein [Syntrophales bacterium]